MSIIVDDLQILERKLAVLQPEAILARIEKARKLILLEPDFICKKLIF